MENVKMYYYRTYYNFTMCWAETTEPKEYSELSFDLQATSFK